MTGAGDIGITSADFTNAPLVDLGSSVTWEAVTKTTNNITGDETLSYAGGVAKTVVFVKRTQRYAQGPEGLVDLGDAYCMSENSDGFKFNDRITYNGEKFLIGDVITRRANGEVMFDFANCFKVED
jgi:hypothetical protein